MCRRSEACHTIVRRPIPTDAGHVSRQDHRAAAVTPRPRLTPPMRLLTGALGSPIRNLAGGAAFVAGVVALAVLGYTLSGWGFGDAFCMAVLTVFTVGYGEVRPINTPYLRKVTIGLIWAAPE